jgi:predicted O-linked N-acetylglucosamine transferase (SPINDLY family)
MASTRQSGSNQFSELQTLGHSFWKRGDLPGAANAFEKALEWRPADGPTLSNLASVLAMQGKFDDAIRVFTRALDLEPANFSTMENLGTALFSLKRFAEAEAWFRKALVLNPASAALHNKIATALASQDRLDAAIDEYKKAVAIKADLASAWSSLGALYRGIGQLDQSISSFRYGLNAKADPHIGSGMLYSMLFHPGYSSEHLLDEHRKWDEMFARSHYPARPPAKQNVAGRRIRVGYVSPYFRQHVVGTNLIPLVREHNRSEFEIFCYSHTAARDLLTKRFQSTTDHWRDITALDDKSAADLIRVDGIDILVETALHMAEHRLLLFAMKPAAVQVTFAGYPGTTGLSAMDFRLTDGLLDPPGQSDQGRYSEGSIRLKSFWCFDPLGEELPISESPVTRNGRVTFGCLCTFAKVSDPILNLWGRILSRVPGSRLILLTPAGRARERVRTTMATHDVDASRIEFHSWMPRLQYMQLYDQIDIFLDSFPYNGHSTMIDALWMGVCPLSLRGETVVSRGGLSILSNLGLGEHVAKDEDEYLCNATKVAGDPASLANLRHGMRQRMRQSCLMDATGFARGVEAAFREMMR